jgi:hypothetical protein
MRKTISLLVAVMMLLTLSLSAFAFTVPDLAIPAGGSLKVNCYNFSAYNFQATGEVNAERKFRPDANVAFGDYGDQRNIGWSSAGDWFDYEIEFPAAGSYSVVVEAAGGAGDFPVSVLLNGSKVIDGFTCTATGGWNQDYFRTFNIGSFNANAGTHTVRISFDDGRFNFRGFTITAGAAGTGTGSGTGNRAAKTSDNTALFAAIALFATAACAFVLIRRKAAAR